MRVPTVLGLDLKKNTDFKKMIEKNAKIGPQLDFFKIGREEEMRELRCSPQSAVLPQSNFCVQGNDVIVIWVW